MVAVVVVKVVVVVRGGGGVLYKDVYVARSFVRVVKDAVIEMYIV